MKRTSHDRLYHLVLVAIFALANAAVATASPASKVTICHFPPSNRDHVQILTVGAPALPGHLAHYDAVCPAGSSNCCFEDDGHRGRTGDRDPHQVSQPSVCTNFQTDPNNCGSCGNV